MQQFVRLESLQQRLRGALRHVINARMISFTDQQGRFWRASPLARVRDAAVRHDALLARLISAGSESVRAARERLLPLLRTLNAVSPLATLERGYSIVSDQHGKILRDASEAAVGTIIEARLAVGSLRAKVQDP
jgi:exodeoxyribonuclease VII large subunit